MILAQKLLAEPEKFAAAYNFGPAENDSWPVERIATKLVEMWGNGASWTRDVDPGAHEAHYLRLDANKARFELGWEPKLRTETALEWTIKWYRAWQEGQNMAEFTTTQIEEYQKRCGR